MPMDFPDLNSLKFAAKAHKFRKPNKNKTEDQYREALADHVQPIDDIESWEIRLKVGWDKWSEEQKCAMILSKAEY